MVAAVSSSTSNDWFAIQQQQQQQQQGQSQQTDPMQDVATLLGMSDDDLKTAMKSGTTLSSIAKTKGVSESDLESTIAKSLQNNPPPGATGTLSDTQAAQMASDIATGKGPQGGGHHHHHSSSSNSSSSGTDAITAALSASGTSSVTSLDSLASALGIDSDTLTSQLSSGDTTDLGQELMTALQSSSSSGTSSGVTYDGYM